MAEGTVKWFDEKKGFGFISSQSGPDVFVHYTSITGADGFKTLVEGDAVTYDIVKGEKGPKAENVMRKNDAN
ncbi:MAG: hypothetical protein A2178_01555 [Planctomycetes bacterium GWC2_49_10]|nr:MAG: hypothetical protein A2178_01555 [Planctomycetes bacterium GWC2_49_10]